LNLHGIVAPVIGAVNPLIPVTAKISVGQADGDDGKVTPLYATPGSFVGAISGTTFTISSITAGVPQPGQTLADLTSALLPGTSIVSQLTGPTGGLGTYEVNQEQTVASETMTTALNLIAQVQPMTWRDIQNVDGLNLQGTRYKIYLYGEIDGLVRPERKGGDLIIIPSGRHAGTYLVAQVLEQFPDWVSAACTLQNGA
jgi:hypothetical protein